MKLNFLSSRLLVLGLVVLPLATLGRVVGHDFISMDDPVYWYRNPHVNTGLTWDNFVWAWTTLETGLWQPAVWMSLQWDGSLGGATPWVYHLDNLLWHTANVVLVYFLLSRMTGAPGRSAVVAALLAVHPLHVESVAWVTERKDVLSGFFALLTLWAHCRYVDRPSWRNYALVGASLFLGLASKAILVAWPVVLLLVDIWPLGRLRAVDKDKQPRALAWLVVEKLPWFFMSGLFVLLTVFAHGNEKGLADTSVIPLNLRLANAIFSAVWYLGKTFWPVGLGAFYPHPRLPWSAWEVWGSALILMAIAALVALVARRRSEQLVGWLWFFVMLAPYAQVIQAGDAPRADRFVYLAHIGLFVAIVWGAADVLAALRVPAKVRTSFAAAGVALLAVLCWLQAGHWKNDETLWRHTLQVAGADNYRAHGFLGVHYYFQGKKELADDHLAAACAHPFGRNLFGLLYGTRLNERALESVDRRLFGEAISYLKLVLLRDSDSADAHYNLGLAYFHREEYADAARHWKKMLEQRSGSRELYHALGVALQKAGRNAEAEEYFRQAP